MSVLELNGRVFDASTTGTLTLTGEGSATTDVTQGLAKAWFNYNQSSGSESVQDSFNISSISDDSTGVFTNSFSSNMSNAFWAGPMLSRNNRTQYNTDTGASSGRAFRSADSDNNAADQDSNTVACFGDLA